MKTYIFDSDYPYGSKSYVLEADGEFAIIDPSVSPSKVFSSLNINPSEFKYIILTHAHFDHFLTVDDWCDATNLPVWVGEKDAESLKDSTLNCYLYFLGINKAFKGKICTLSKEDKLRLGACELEIFETPGHSPGSITVKFGSALFVGDVFFPGGAIGRTDLPGGNYCELLASIKKISELKGCTEFYSGH